MLSERRAAGAAQQKGTRVKGELQRYRTILGATVAVKRSLRGGFKVFGVDAGRRVPLGTYSADMVAFYVSKGYWKAIPE